MECTESSVMEGILQTGYRPAVPARPALAAFVLLYFIRGRHDEIFLSCLCIKRV